MYLGSRVWEVMWENTRVIICKVEGERPWVKKNPCVTELVSRDFLMVIKNWN